MAPSRRTGLAFLTVLVLLLVVVSVLWSLQRRMIYFPDRVAPPQPPAGVRDVELTTSDGLRLAAWLAAPTATDAHIAVLVAPGNAGNRRDRLPLASAFAREGHTVLLLDYRGYGGNPGSPSEAGLARDVRAAWAYLTGPASFPAGRVVLFGESLGAAVVSELATEVAPAGLVLRSPFESLAAVGREHYPLLPVALLLRDRFPVAEDVGRVTAPTTVVYGTADSIVPPGHSRTVFARAANPVRALAVDGADHNDPALTAGPEVVAAVRTIVRMVH
jgi:uncharacterized protein